MNTVAFSTPGAVRQPGQEVLVVGAGPVGLFAALWLSERGVHVRIIDSYQRAALHSYALALHPQSLRLLDELGIAEDLIARGQRIESVIVHPPGGEPVELDFAAVKGVFPFALVIPQILLEGALEKRLRENAVEVDWHHQVLSLDEDDGGVSAQIGQLSDSGEDVRLERTASSFLVAADGYRSFVRRAIRIDLTPVGAPLRFGLVESRSDFGPRNEMHLVLSDRTSDAFWPIPPDRGRWSVQIADGQPDDVDTLRDRIRERAPWYPQSPEPVEWITTVRFQPRLARRFGRGRVWMAGDCARFTSLLGVQSMNVGLREAHDLTRRLAGILHKGRSQDLLRFYNEERRREWNMLLGLKNRLRRTGASLWTPESAARLIRILPASGVDLNRLLEQIGFRLHWTRHEH